MAAADYPLRGGHHHVRADYRLAVSLIHLGRAWLFYWMIQIPDEPYLWAKLSVAR